MVSWVNGGELRSQCDLVEVCVHPHTRRIRRVCGVGWSLSKVVAAGRADSGGAPITPAPQAVVRLSWLFLQAPDPCHNVSDRAPLPPLLTPFERTPDGSRRRVEGRAEWGA